MKMSKLNWGFAGSAAVPVQPVTPPVDPPAPVWPPKFEPVAFAANYVKPGGTGTAMDSWSTAAGSIQAAVDLAAVNGRPVVIYPGDYVEDVASKGNNLTLIAYNGPETTFDGKFRRSAVNIRGTGSTDTVLLSHEKARAAGIRIAAASATRHALYARCKDGNFRFCDIDGNGMGKVLRLERTGVRFDSCGFFNGAYSQNTSIDFFSTASEATFTSCRFESLAKVNITSGTGYKFRQCNFLRAKETLFWLEPGTDALLTNCIVAAMGDNYVTVSPFTIKSGATVTAENCLLLTGGQSAKSPLKSDAGTLNKVNCLYEMPDFVSPRYPQASIGFGVDDNANIAYAHELSLRADKYGQKVTIYLDTRVPEALPYTDGKYALVREMLDRGHGVGGHTRNSPHLGDPQGETIAIKYTGAGAATATVAGNTLTLKVNGATVLTQPLADRELSTAGLIPKIAAVAGFSAQIANTTYYGNARAFCLANVSGLAVSSSAYTPVPLDVTAFYDEEISGCRADLKEIFGAAFPADVFSYPYNSRSAAADAAMAARGVRMARGGGSTASGLTSQKLESLNAYKVFAPWLTNTTAQYTTWDVSTEESNRAGAAAVLSTLSEAGWCADIYAHNMLEMTMEQWEVVFQEAAKAGVTARTFAGLSDHVHAKGTSADGVTYAVPLTPAPDYHLKATSVLRGAGKPGEPATDYEGNAFASPPPVGAYN